MIRRIPRVEKLEEDKRCAKHEEALIANKIVEEEQIEETTSIEEEVHATKEEELPFQDVLADQRRKYTPTQKYVQLIYDDLVKFFVKKWEGNFLRKTVIPIETPNPISAETEESQIEPSEDDFEAVNDKETSTVYWKPDEMVEIEFVNGNKYTGRVSKQKMEGQGIYRWYNGSQYKGSFEDNKIQGKGELEWQDYVRYEGDLEDGYCHGKGTMMDKNYNLLYIGEWKKGRKHGKGYCRYADNDSYDGNWVEDKREGVGCRVYTNGARYVGDWKNSLRHGTGTMIWPNGDCYRGQWNQGQMHGYGEYTWNRSFSKGLCWPQETKYIGQWYQSTRNGEGQLMLNSIGAAQYSGFWKENKKHGHGKIIGNNGDITEDDPLFLNNILRPIPTLIYNPEEDGEKNSSKDNGSHLNKFVKKPPKILEARMTSVLKPEQCPSLSYYIDRLREADTISSSCSIPLISGKCKQCKEMSCHCLAQSSQDQNHSSRSLSKESTLKAISESAISSSDLDKTNGNNPTPIVKINDADSGQLDEEQRWAYTCIAMHMPRIRKIYDVYSKIFCDEPSKCRLSMSRLSLWQLWRDCKIYEKNLSLVQIDKYLAANKLALMENPHSPYERIQLWQLINALLEVSWHLYSKNEDINKGGYPGRLANGLHKFLVDDIYPNFGNCTGVMCGPERDLLSTHAVYQLYKSIGEPHSLRHLLKTICSMETQSLFPLRKLGATELIQIMSITCPSIKEPETNIIINLEYELTFLEFLEIFIEAGKRLVRKKKLQLEAARKKAEAVETNSMMSLTKGDRTNRSSMRVSEGIASSKSRKKLVKKY